MNILMVCSPITSLKEPYDGGTESFVVNLANALVARGHTVDVVASAADERNTFQLIEFADSPLSMKDDIYEEWQGQEFHKFSQFALMNMDRYDVIHYSSFVSEIYEAGAFFSKPSVLTLHWPCDDKFKKMYGLFARRSGAACVAVSERIYNEWHSFLPSKMHTISNGVNLDDWPLTPGKKHYFLWSGRINNDKNPLDAIKIAKHLNYPLKIAGRITDEDYFNKCIKPLLDDNIQYVGHIAHTDIAALAREASVFLATAKWQEPFGFSALEMLACGVPVVGYASAVPPELRNSDVSIAINSDRWQDLLPAIEGVRGVTPQACRDFAATFSLEKTCRSYIQLYESLIKKGGGDE